MIIILLCTFLVLMAAGVIWFCVWIETRTKKMLKDMGVNFGRKNG